MKINLREKEFKLWIIVSLVLIVIWVLVLFTLNSGQKENEKAFLDEELNRFEGEVNSILKTYESFSNYIFDEISADQDIIEMMYQANYASEEEKDVIRSQLYDKLSEKYMRMKKYEYRQLHFHLPNTESFLRLHAPDLYGDLLLNVRESVRIANEDKIKVSGFEEGRVFNGFRFVYPLEYDNQHIGSVEVSISSGSVVESLSKLFSKEDFYFVIEKSFVEDKVFDDYLENYRGSNILDDYYVDKEVDKITNDFNTVVPVSRELFFADLKDEHNENLNDRKSFALSYNYDGRDYTIKFLAIENFKVRPVAYLVSVAESGGYQKISVNLYLQIILVTLLVLFVSVFGFLVAFYQNKRKRLSERDYLTGIYNRSKFYEIVEREAKCSNRYKYDSSIMMMDIDYFKKINDTYGHEWGDKVLKALASVISENIRETDVFARWGGEEFVLLLPHTSKEDAVKVAEKIRLLIDESEIDKLKGVTISIGVSQIDPESFDVDYAIKLADEAMYRAKRNGRNKVCASEDKVITL